MKRRTWYCYRLEEKRSKCDKPYYGKTYDLVRRAKRWKDTLKLDYIPELHIEYTDTSEQRVFDFEQEKRVTNCWPRESSLRHQRKIRKKGAEVAGKIIAESGKMNLIRTKESCSKGGKITGKMCAENGHMDRIRTKESCTKGGSIGSMNPNHPNKQIHECPWCGKIGKGLGMFTYHFDRCKLKPQQSRQSHQL